MRTRTASLERLQVRGLARAIARWTPRRRRLPAISLGLLGGLVLPARAVPRPPPLPTAPPEESRDAPSFFEGANLLRLERAQSIALAPGAGDAVWAAWVEARGAGPEAPREVRVARIDLGKASLDLETRVSLEGEAIVSGWQSQPRLATSPTGQVAVVWPVEGRTARIRLARSRDGGRTFEPPRDLPARAPRKRGYPDIAMDREGALGIVWLEAMHRLASGRYAWNLRGTFAGPRGEPGPARQLDATTAHGICDCCRPTIVPAGGGRFHVGFRDDDEGLRSVRIRTGISGRKGKGEDVPPPAGAPRTIGAAGWRTAACPNDAPVLTREPGALRAAVWREGHGASQGVYARVSRDGGRTFGAQRRCETPGQWRPGHPDAAFGREGTLWIVLEETSQSGQRIGLYRSPGSAEGTEGIARAGGTEELPSSRRPAGEDALPAIVTTDRGIPVIGWISRRRGRRDAYLAWGPRPPPSPAQAPGSSPGPATGAGAPPGSGGAGTPPPAPPRNFAASL